MIEIDNISKSFAGKMIIEGISGRFENGKTNLIIGASGAGKSVLLKCIVGLILPDTGHVLYNGRNFTRGGKDLVRSVRREIGMLFQGIALFDSKTVEENVRFPLDILTKMTDVEKNERVDFCLERVGLPGIHAKMPSELSGGMKKRVGIARAIANESRYLFCDEPNSGLDPQTALRIDQLIKEITVEYKITTVVVTHDMNSVMEIGDSIMFIYEGRKQWEGTNQNILHTTSKEMEDFILANRLVREYRKNARG